MQSNQCVNCKRYQGLGECEAFPDGIPEEIMTGTHDHSEPFEGDQGLLFDPMDPDPEE